MVDGVIKPLGELVQSMRYASDLLDPNRVTYTVPWWGPYKAEPINEPPILEVVAQGLPAEFYTDMRPYRVWFKD